MALLFAKNNSLSAVTALPASISGGGLNLISTQTASSSASINFTSGLDSTYKHYVFKFYNFHPQNNAVRLKFNGSDDTSSHSYDVVKTTTMFNAYHNEGGSTAALAYETGTDEAQSSGSAFLGNDTKNDDDASMSGYLEIFDPSSTVFVKHFISRATTYANGDYAVDSYKAGYFNTTSAITAIQFTASSGNIDSGTFKLYGVT
jgi:hypothetical protein